MKKPTLSRKSGSVKEKIFKNVEKKDQMKNLEVDLPPEPQETGGDQENYKLYKDDPDAFLADYLSLEEFSDSEIISLKSEKGKRKVAPSSSKEDKEQRTTSDTAKKDKIKVKFVEKSEKEVIKGDDANKLKKAKGGRLSPSLPINRDVEKGAEAKEREKSASLKSQAEISKAWHQFRFHKDILSFLTKKEFTEPTGIQSAVFKRLLNCDKNELSSLKKFDIMAAAPTGSGKTMAFTLPVVQHILTSQHRPQSSQAADALDKSPIQALILVPTRELGLQIGAHLLELIRVYEGSFLPIRVAELIGGISLEKQKRLLKKSLQILIATPGRLHQWTHGTKDKGQYTIDDEERSRLNSRLKGLRFLIVDEVDRMVEQGHFRELVDIFNMIRENDDALNEKGLSKDKRQTFVFSATLGALKNSFKVDSRLNKKGPGQKASAHTLENLAQQIPFIDQNPVFLQLNKSDKDSSSGTQKADISKSLSSTVDEYKIICSSDQQKDLLLYYFLLQAGSNGRTIIFANSIDCIKRLSSLLKQLFEAVKDPPIIAPIHSLMAQRQRLKNLDRFKNNTNSILIATDVAGRGLDIPNVDRVIHYQVPRTSEIYVHRSGRTGRAFNSGDAIIFVSPNDFTPLNKLCLEMKRDVADMPEFPLDLGNRQEYEELEAFLKKSIQIESDSHRELKKKKDRSWMRKAAEDLGVDYEDSDGDSDDDDEEKHVRKNRSKLPRFRD